MVVLLGALLSISSFYLKFVKILRAKQNNESLPNEIQPIYTYPKT